MTSHIIFTTAAALIAVCISSFSFAEEATPPTKKINLAPSKYQDPATESGTTAELLKNTKPIQKKTPGPGIRFSVGCTSSNGKAVSANDPGYEDCLKSSNQSVNPPNLLRQPK